MPDYLSSTRKTVASALWIPLSWLVQALVFALLIQIVVAVFAIQTTLEPSTAITVIGLLPLLGVTVSAIAALTVIRDYRGNGISQLWLFLRAFLWIFSLPARGWLIGFGAVLQFMVTFFLAVTVGIMGLLITWWAVSTMIDFGANGWLILLVGIALPGITVGGSAWANQYGSGTTGGTPVGCFLVVAVGIPAVFLWFCLLVVVLVFFALPASLVLFGFHGGTLGSMTWEWHEWLIALGVFAVMVVPPLAVDGISQAAVGRTLDRLPYVGRKRAAHRQVENAIAKARLRGDEETAKSEIDRKRQAVWVPLQAQLSSGSHDPQQSWSVWGDNLLERQRLGHLEAEIRATYPLGLSVEARLQLKNKHPWASSIIDQLA